GERARTLRLLIGVAMVSAVSSIDTLLLYRVWGVYPVGWLAATVAAMIALYVVLRTDLLRPQGLDRGVVIELGSLLVSGAIIAGLTLLLGASPSLPLVALSAIAWALVTGLAWASARARPVRIKGERELERFITRVPAFENERSIDDKLSALWKRAVGISVRTLW